MLIELQQTCFPTASTCVEFGLNVSKFSNFFIQSFTLCAPAAKSAHKSSDDSGFFLLGLPILHQLVERLLAQVLYVVLAKFIERALVMEADPVFDTSSEAKSLSLEYPFFLANELEPKGR